MISNSPAAAIRPYRLKVADLSAEWPQALRQSAKAVVCFGLGGDCPVISIDGDTITELPPSASCFHSAVLAYAGALALARHDGNSHWLLGDEQERFNAAVASVPNELRDDLRRKARWRCNAMLRQFWGQVDTLARQLVLDRTLIAKV